MAQGDEEARTPDEIGIEEEELPMREEIEKALGDDLRRPGKAGIAAMTLQPLLRDFERNGARQLAARELDMPEPGEALQRGREGLARHGVVENRAVPNLQALPGKAEASADEGVRVVQPAGARIVGIEPYPVGNRSPQALAIKPA